MLATNPNDQNGKDLKGGPKRKSQLIATSSMRIYDQSVDLKMKEGLKFVY